MRIVFMGTPDFPVPALKALVEAGHQVIAVVTQPDKPKGRGKEVQMTPVKIQAMEYGIPVYQPAKVREASLPSCGSPCGEPPLPGKTPLPHGRRSGRSAAGGASRADACRLRG